MAASSLHRKSIIKVALVDHSLLQGCFLTGRRFGLARHIGKLTLHRIKEDGTWRQVGHGTGFRISLHCFMKWVAKHNPNSSMSWARAWLGPGLAWLGPRPGLGSGPGSAWAGPAWAWARLGPGPGLGPGPAWARARLGTRPGLGPGPAWARAWLGPGRNYKKNNKN